MSNNNDYDQFLDSLVRNAMVPKGFRPESDIEIEQMLDAMGSVEMPNDKLERVLAKFAGTVPLRWEAKTPPDDNEKAIESAEARELAEMFRAKGTGLPAELEEKLREMEDRAAQSPPDDENDNVD